MVFKIVGIKEARMVLYSLMSTLDLTAVVHKERRKTSNEIRSNIGRFRARFDYLYAGKAVLATETATDVWSVTTFPGVAVTNADDVFDHIFYGGRTYTVTGSLATALSTAGYDVS